MPVEISQFKACRPTSWHGRYARIPGDTSVFHLRSVNGRMWPVIEWSTEDGRGTCPAIRNPATEELADAVGRAKRHAGGDGGGSFLINEFGQVLVPASDGKGQRFLAGHLNGRLLFENPFDPDDVIDLGDCSHLQPGDPWKLPYVGIPYNLNGRSQIYFYELNSDGGSPVFPPRQDQSLIQAFRRIRRTGAVRFIVNHAGLVLTKCPNGEQWSADESWQPVFVGQINRSLWFGKE